MKNKTRRRETQEMEFIRIIQLLASASNAALCIPENKEKLEEIEDPKDARGYRRAG
jgi:hypothetical protein